MLLHDGDKEKNLIRKGTFCCRKYKVVNVPAVVIVGVVVVLVVVGLLESTAELSTDGMAVLLMYVPAEFEIAVFAAAVVEPVTDSANKVRSVDSVTVTL